MGVINQIKTAHIASQPHIPSIFLIFHRKYIIHINHKNQINQNNKAIFQSHIIHKNCGTNNNNHKILTNINEIS